MMIEAGAWLGASGALLLAALAFAPVDGLSPRSELLAVMVYFAVAALVLRGLPHHAARRRFGLANGVTLLRAAATAFMAGLAAVENELTPAARAGIAILGFAALLLDGVDG